MKGFTIVLKKKRKYKKYRFKVIYFVPIVVAVFFAITLNFIKGKKQEENFTMPPQEIIDFKTSGDYAEYYMPVVIDGFFLYKKGDKTENKTLIKLAVWSVLCSENTADYEAFDGELVIPADVVEERVKQLFSQDVSLTDETVNEEKYSITFDKDTDSYFIPTMGFTPEYTPVLESAETKKDKTILTVGCLKSENYKQDSLGNTVAPEAEKRLIITLKKSEEGYYIEEISES